MMLNTFMGPGFFVFFPDNDHKGLPTMKVALNLVNYSSTKLQVTKSTGFALNVAQKSEHKLKVII